MLGLVITLTIISLLASFYNLKLTIYTGILLLTLFAFKFFAVIANIEFTIIAIPVVLLSLILNIKKLRIYLFSKPLYKYFQSSNANWQTFKPIDDGWFASDFEQAIFCGKPKFNLFTKQYISSSINKSNIDAAIYEIIAGNNSTSNRTKINKLAKIGGTSLLVDKIYQGQSLNPHEISSVLKNISNLSPVLATILGFINLDSLTSIIHYFGSVAQRKKLLPLFSQAKLIPFLKPTSLYETLDSQKSSIEGRIEKKFINGTEILGVRISFQDVILLGTSQSNCFYLNVNIKDFNNYHGNKTHLGTALCIINQDIKNLAYRKGLKAYDGYLNYYACTGDNVFIPFSHIINESHGLGKGLEYLYKTQCIASSIWPLAVSIPTNKTATLTAWYFAHLQKQNGRQLLSFKVVMAKLNEQFSQCLKLQLTDNLLLHNNLQPELLKFTAILNKETHITQTMNQLGVLRSILGSNSHNIKTGSNLRSFDKVVHLATELDGISHEINQLPLMKKAALACHPYYSQEVELLSQKDTGNYQKFDQLIFQHIGYILHNLTKTWAYTLRTSAIVRLFLPKYKYKYMIKRMSSSLAFLSDITLITWTFKSKINTSFASFLAQCMQDLTALISIYDNYISNLDATVDNKELTKITLKNTLYSAQNSLKNTINIAFNRVSALFMKIMIFPLGRPFQQIKTFKSLHKNIETLCKLQETADSPYSNYSTFLRKIFLAKQQLQNAAPAETAITNATGTPMTTDNYEVLINRCLAAGIVSVEQSENLRSAYESILDIKLTNHFGNQNETPNN
ncbi:MAG: DUF1974 domain-containing protein [Proteobacteria bacterium]|nr:DUF1974 domain-containing protein [Pseudomonadota bacterium]